MTPELSIVVPVLNETATLPELFATLAHQQEVAFELLICDGGSSDGTAELAQRLSGEAPFPVRVISSPPGRAHQMNCGALASGSEYLLFLHADSLLPDCRALRTGIDALAAEMLQHGHHRIAGRFALRFNLQESGRTWGFYHLECKARLNRRECIHGDQGYLLRRDYFNEVGPFDPALPMLSETCLAETIRTTGLWLLLPADIMTSPRRFMSEGLYERQVLNAILMNFAALRWEDFFRELPAIYPRHDHSGRLQLGTLLSRLGRLIRGLSFRQRLSLWYRTGTYVRSHAWQIPFQLDTRRNFRSGLTAGTGPTPLLNAHDRCFDRCTDHAAGWAAAGYLTWLWFLLIRLHLLIRSTTSR